MTEASISAVRGRRPGVILPWAAFAITFLAIALTANRGLEMSDEAFYILAITDPASFKANIHPFGALFHLVWQAVGQSIVLLRLFGLCLLAASSATLGFYIGRYYQRVCGRTLGFDPVAVAGFFGLAYYADISILTPSYNLLANSAACLILAGILGWWAQDNGPEPETTGAAPSLLVGFGGCLAFYGKPTFAALAAIAVIVVLARQMWRGGMKGAVRRLALTAIACLVPLVLIAAISVDVPAYLAALGEGLRVLRFGNELGSLPLKTFFELLYIPRPLVLTGLLLAAIAVWRGRGASARLRKTMATAAWILLLFDIGFYAMWLVAVIAGNHLWFVMSMPTYTVTLGILAVGLARADPGAVTWRDLLPVVVLLGLPFAIAFGSASNIVVQIAISIFAYLLAGAILVDLLLSRRAAAAMQLFLIAYAAALLVWTAHRPYRLPTPIWAQTQPIDFGPAHDRLYVDAKTQLFVESLRDLARRERLTSATPIIDLTYNGPGVAMLLNGNAPYFPWILSLYGGGSVDLANAVWRSLGAQEKHRAWIILPAHPALMPSEPMQAFLRDRGRYRLAGRVPNMSYLGGAPIEIWVPKEN